jgi:hypothetical protein
MLFVDDLLVENIGPLENAVTQLSEGMSAVINEQNYMKMRERAHRNSTIYILSIVT